jgi:hypothetical protein
LIQQIRFVVALKARHLTVAFVILVLGTQVAGSLAMVKPTVEMVQQPEDQAKEAAVHVTVVMAFAMETAAMAIAMAVMATAVAAMAIATEAMAAAI